MRLCEEFLLRRGRRAKIGNRAGLTLVEVVVALAIALILGAGIYQIFAGTQRSLAVNTSLGTLQDSGRFAMYVLRSEIRGAGYTGCQSENFTSLLNIDLPDYPGLNFRQVIYGLEADGDVWLDNKGVEINPSEEGLDKLNLTDPEPLPGNDILVVRGVRPLFQEKKLLEDPHYVTTQDVLDLERLPDGESNAMFPLAGGGGDILVVSSCKHSVLFRSTDYTPPTTGAAGKIEIGLTAGDTNVPGNGITEFGTGFERGSTVLIPQTQVFYLGLQDDGEPGLYRKVIGSGVDFKDGGFRFNTPSELIASGAERFFVRYYGEGVNEYGHAVVDLYDPADEVSNWSNVRSIRIGLLMRSEEVADNLAPLDTAEYHVSGDEDADFVAPGDRRLRMVFTGTVTLRNRVR